MRLLDDSVVIITGAAGNLGSNVARAARGAGAKTALVDRSLDHLRRVHGDVADDPSHLLAAVDLADLVAVEAFVATVKSRLGAPTGLVNTVGGYRGDDPVERSEWATWESMFAMNVRPTLVCSRAVLPGMRETGHGSILNVASLAGRVADANGAAYAAAKASVLRLTEALAAEMKAEGVRVNAVLPGALATPQNEAWMSPAQLAAAVDLGALADVVLFFLSDMSRAVTGAALEVKGKQ